MTKTDIINALPNIQKTWMISHERASAFIRGIKEIYSKYDTSHIYSVLGSNYVVGEYVRCKDDYHRIYTTLINEKGNPEGFGYHDEGRCFLNIVKVNKMDFLSLLLEGTKCNSLEEFFDNNDVPHIRTHLLNFANILQSSDAEIDHLLNNKHILNVISNGLWNLNELAKNHEKVADDSFFKAFNCEKKTYKPFRVKIIIEEIQVLTEKTESAIIVPSKERK